MRSIDGDQREHKGLARAKMLSRENVLPEFLQAIELKQLPTLRRNTLIPQREILNNFNLKKFNINDQLTLNRFHYEKIFYLYDAVDPIEMYTLM